MDFKVTIYVSMITGAIFGAVSFIFNFGDWIRLIVAVIFGLFVGLMAAPELEPKKFKYGWILQISAGIVAGVMASLFFRLTGEEVLSCGFIGGFIGWLAPLWVKHVPIP